MQAAELLGEADRGFRVAMRSLDLFRPSVGAFAVGMAQAAIDAAVAHAGGRMVFGGPLKDQQAISHLLAEMATRTEAARLLVYAAATAYDAGEQRIAGKSAMAKLFAHAPQPDSREPATAWQNGGIRPVRTQGTGRGLSMGRN